jgi:uncharacterized iron-regulated membrane protein
MIATKFLGKGAGRRLYRGIHRVLGFAFGAFFVTQGLTGAVMVFRGNVDAFLDPAAFAVSGPTVRIGPDAAVALARHAFNGRLRSLDLPLSRSNPGGRVYVVHLIRGGDTRAVYVDPNDGRILARRPDNGGPTQWVYDLHTELLLPNAGTNVIGGLGALLVITSVTGLLLWPGWRDARSGWSFKREPSARRAGYDIHKVTGIAAAAFLIFSGSSGILLTFKSSMNAVLHVTPPPRAPAHHAGALPVTIATLVASAQSVFPNSQLRTLHFFAADGRPVVAELRGANDLDQLDGNKRVYVDRFTGIAIGSTDGMRKPIDGWSDLTYALHTGRIYGIGIVQVGLVCIGVAPILLLGSALIVWLARIRFERRREGRSPSGSQSQRT